MDHGPAGEKNDGEYTVAARIRTAIARLGPTIAHVYQSVLYGPYRYDLGGTRADRSTCSTESVLYGPYRYDLRRHEGWTIAHVQQSVLYGPYRYDLGGTRADYSTCLSESVLYGPYRYDLGGTGLVYEFITGSVFGEQVTWADQENCFATTCSHHPQREGTSHHSNSWKVLRVWLGGALSDTSPPVGSG